MYQSQLSEIGITPTKHAVQRMSARAITGLQLLCVDAYGEEFYQGNGDWYVAIPKSNLYILNQDTQIILKMLNEPLED